MFSCLSQRKDHVLCELKGFWKMSRGFSWVFLEPQHEFSGGRMPTDHSCTPKVHKNGPARFGGQGVGSKSRYVSETNDGLVLSIFLI